MGGDVDEVARLVHHVELAGLREPLDEPAQPEPLDVDCRRRPQSAFQGRCAHNLRSGFVDFAPSAGFHYSGASRLWNAG